MKEWELTCIFPSINLLSKLTKKVILTEMKIKKNERQTKIEKNPNCKFFYRINLDLEGFDIFLEISKI